MQQINFVGRNYTVPENVKEYVVEKISKHENLLKRSTNINSVITQNSTDHGKRRNFKVEVSIDMPHAFIKVEDRGQSVQEVVDKIEVVLRRRLKRYHEQFKKWTKTEPWKSIALDNIYDEINDELGDISFTEYTPEIKVKEYADDTPITPAEAIEKMELLGHNSYLFKNIETGKYTMIYKRLNKGYGMIQPKD